MPFATRQPTTVPAVRSATVLRPARAMASSGDAEQARTALEQSGTPAPEVLELARRLEALEARLEVVATSLEMVAEMHSRLPAAWNVLAENLDALTAATSGPMAKLGLALKRTPRV